MKSNQSAPHPDATSFRRTLQDELARRCARNGQYSLRAFARDLETDHSTLSQIMRGRRTLTERAIRKLGASLGLASEDIERTVLSESRQGVHEHSGRSVEVLRELTEDALAVIRGFEHYAILELTHLDDFNPDVSWISRMLGIDSDAINVAIARLLRLELLKMTSATTWVDCTGDVTNFLDGIAYEAVSNLSERAREHAIAAGLAAPDRLREFSSTTLAVDRRKLPEALAILTRARNDLLSVLSESDRRDQVYRLDLSLLPLTDASSPAMEKDPDE